MASLRHMIWLQNVANWKHMHVQLPPCILLLSNTKSSWFGTLGSTRCPFAQTYSNKRGRHGLLYMRVNKCYAWSCDTNTRNKYRHIISEIQESVIAIVWGWNTGNTIFHELSHSIAWSTCNPNWLESAIFFLLGLATFKTIIEKCKEKTNIGRVEPITLLPITTIGLRKKMQVPPPAAETLCKNWDQC